MRKVKNHGRDKKDRTNMIRERRPRKETKRK